MTELTPPGSSQAAPEIPPVARVLFCVAALCIAVYVVNVVAGKIAAKGGFELPLRLGDIGEFLVVLVSAAVFVAGLLLAESAHDRPPH